jgi:hypothetical protein
MQNRQPLTRNMTFAMQFENMFIPFNQLLMIVDGDHAIPAASNKQHDISSILADAVSEGGAWTSSPRLHLRILQRPRTSTRAYGLTYSLERSITLYHHQMHLNRDCGRLDTTRQNIPNKVKLNFLP